MGRDELLQFYTTGENGEWLTEQAEAADKSLSEYCHQLVEEHINREQDRKQYGRYGVDQQIELVLDQIRDEATTLLATFQSETGPKIDRVQRIRTVYVIALWHLFKNNYSSSEREAALKRAGEFIGRDPSNDPELRAALPVSDIQTSRIATESDSSAHHNTSGGDSE